MTASSPPSAKPAHSAKPAPATDPIVGIDLGTTNSLVAHCTEAGPVILASPEGHRSLPSVVRLLPSSTADAADRPPSDDATPGSSAYTVAALGQAARDHALQHPTTTLHSTKRLLGRSAADLADDLPHLAYRIIEGPHDTARIELGPDPSLTVTPQEVAAVLLRELKRWADTALGTPVTRAVITVPAYFDDAQRQATRDACRLAGLQVLRLVNEPTAAALAYGLGLRKSPNGQEAQKLLGIKSNPSPQPTLAELGSPPTKSVSLNTKLNPAACSTDAEPSAPESRDPAAPSVQTVAIYDLGGGTFDVSLLRLQSAPPSPEQPGGGTLDQVLATDGDTHLGGDDLDQQLIQYFITQIQSNTETNKATISDSPGFQQALRHAAEHAKIQLSTQDAVEVQLDLPPAAPETNLTDSSDSKPHSASQKFSLTLTRATFDDLVTPLIDRTLTACKRALNNAGLTPADLDQVILVGGSTRVPLVREKVAAFFDAEPYTALNPDEVVALGASVQAAILAGIKRDTLLLDVIPLSLGIETMGGAVAKLITANATIPARATERFSTYVDGQNNVKIHVLQGERELVEDCRSLATFDLTGLPPMPAGLPKILVTFLIDANGILSVQALEERSGRRARVQVVPHHGLTSDEITQIEKDSFTHARADMQAHRLIDLRLNANLDLRNIRKQLDRFQENDQTPRGQRAKASNATPSSGSAKPSLSLEPDYRQQIERHMHNVQQFIDTPDANNDADAFQQALHDLDHATLRLAELNIARTLREDTQNAKTEASS